MQIECAVMAAVLSRACLVAWVELLTARRPELISLFTGLSAPALGRLVTAVPRGGGAVADHCPGRQWSLPLTKSAEVVVWGPPSCAASTYCDAELLNP